MSPLLAFSVSLLRPEWMLVLLALPVFALLTLRAARGRPRAGDWVALGVRGLLLLVVALALSLPRIEIEGGTRSVAYVLDVSESVPADARLRVEEFVQRSASVRADEDDASFVVFADGAAVEVPFGRISAAGRAEQAVIDPAHVTSRIARGETDVEAGLRLAHAGFPPGGARRIVLLTDGNQTRGDAVAFAAELVADRVDVQVVPVRYERDREVLLEKLVAPSSSLRDAPVPVKVVLWSSHADVPARIRLLVDGEEALAQDVVLGQGTNHYRLTYEFDRSGFHRLEALVEPALDGNPENNRGLAATQVHGRGRVLVVSAEPQSPLAETLAARLDADVDAGGTELLPIDAGELVPYDAVVLENVPVYQMTDVQRRVLASGVREMGVGLVCVGGTQAYGPGGYAGTELEEVLPVSSEVLQKRVLPSGALVLILHSCEFPGGNAAAREVSKAAILALSAQDEIGVLQWGPQGNDWVVELQQVGNKTRHLIAVDGASPADMPDFDSTIELAQRALSKSRSAVKHVVIISDGDPAPPDAKLIERLNADRISITTILVDPHSGMGAERLMRNIAETTGGNFYSLKSSNLERLPQIFIKEAVTVRRSAWREETFTPALRGVHRMLDGFAAGDFPPLHGYTVTTRKPESEMLLSGPEDDPILCTWRHGLGQAVAFTSDAAPRWARDWTAWPRYAAFWTQVVRSTQRALARPGAQVSTDVEGGAAHVVLDALQPGGDYLDGLAVRGAVVRPDGQTETFRVAQTGPGRYEGRFPATQVGTYLAALTYDDPSGGATAAPAQVFAGVCVPYSAEHLARKSDERFFALLEAEGATVLDLDRLEQAQLDDPQAPDPARLPWLGAALVSVDPVDLWPWIAAAAALLLVLDVAVRRLRIPWARLLRRERRPAPAGAASVAVAAHGPAAPPPRGAFDAEAVPSHARPPVEETPPKPPAAPDSAAPGPQAGAGLLGAKKRAKRKQQWESNE